MRRELGNMVSWKPGEHFEKEGVIVSTVSNVAERSRKVTTENCQLELVGRTSWARDGFNEVVKAGVRLSQLIRELWISK